MKTKQKKSEQKSEFFFQFNEDEPTFTNITAPELNFIIKGEQDITFYDNNGNKFKIFGKLKSEIIYKNKDYSIYKNGRVTIHGVVSGFSEIGLKLKELFPDNAEPQQEQDKNKYSIEDLKEAYGMGRSNYTIKAFNEKFNK